MVRTRLHGLVLLGLGGVLAVPACGHPPVQSGDLAITSVTVIDVESGERRAGQTVVVAGGVIVRVASADDVRLADDIEVVDGRGRFLIPGLWDTHVHSAAARGWHFPLLLAHGVTGVRNMHASGDDPLGVTNGIKEELSSGAILGPRFMANGSVVDGDLPVWPGSVVVRDRAEAESAVARLADGGADFIKVYDSLVPEAFAAIADRARARGIPVDGHVPMLVTPEDAARAGMRTIEHTSGITMGCATNANDVRERLRALYDQGPAALGDRGVAFFTLVRAASDARDPDLCARTAAVYVETGVAVVPTLVMDVDPAGLVADEAMMAMLPARIRGQWTAMAAGGPDPIGEIMGPVAAPKAANVRLLHEAGVPVLAGTDLGNPFLVPGASLHEELARLVDRAGLSPLDALRAATSRAARVLGLDQYGAVVEGRRADLVLLDADPLDDIRNTRAIFGVVLDGSYLDRAALDGLLTRAAQN